MSFETVEERFASQCAAGAFPGGQLVVMQRGQVMSASKPLVAWAIARLEGEGALRVEAPVRAKAR